MDWGLGHATRMVPVIENLLTFGVNVIIGADHRPLDFLRKRFPECSWVRLPGFQPAYQKKGKLLTLKVTTDFPKMMIASRKAHNHLEKLIDEMDIDAVISDNRYELYSDKIPTIFITHQLRILTQGVLAPTQPAVQQFLYSFIEKHDEVWVPDFEGKPNLSGELSHVRKMPDKKVYYIGPLSRFQLLKNENTVGKKFNILGIMSGPEPQRTLFEKILIEQGLKTDFNILILSGKPGEIFVKKQNNIEIRSHAGDEEMASLILSADIVISRSGYTTVMDLATLGKKAVFVPTPGQPEQEYLAKTLKENKLFYSKKQKKFNLEKAVEKAANYSGLTINNDYQLLNDRIQNLLNRLN